MSRQTSDYVDIDDGFADNIMFDTRQLLLYHMLNYTLPLQQSLTDVDPSYPASRGLPRWIARDSNISTETTLLFPSRHHHPPGNLPPPHPPWAPEGGTGTLGGHAQQIRLLFDQSGPSSVGVDVTGRGGAGVWTNWEGNTTDKHPRPVAGDRYRFGSNGIVVGIDRVLDPPVDLGKFLGPATEFLTASQYSLLTLLNGHVTIQKTRSKLTRTSPPSWILYARLRSLYPRAIFDRNHGISAERNTSRSSLQRMRHLIGSMNLRGVTFGANLGSRRGRRFWRAICWWMPLRAIHRPGASMPLML
jgi:hypothetical protein